MRRFSLLPVVLAFALPATAAEKPTVIQLWPGPVPGEKGDLPAESEIPAKPGQRPVQRVTNVSKPTLSVFRPAKNLDTGAAVVIAPGGGYSILAWDLEGEEVAAWLNSIGVTGIVLKYRVPRRASDPKDGGPLGAKQDAQRAIRLVRSQAKEWGLDPKRIGMLGFSAGGHLTTWTLTHPDERSYEPVDAMDQVSSRPDFGVLVYPAYLLDKQKPDQLAAEVTVTKDTPPCFIAHAYDDPLTPEGSVRLFLALKQAKVPAELHVYSTGGHGFGLRQEGKPCATWPQRCEEWLRTAGIIPAKK